MKFNIPTLLTLFRVILIPFFVLAFYLPVHWGLFACALIFTVATATDWFDGFLARQLRQTTKFGAFLDPVADKIIVATALILLTESYNSWYVTLPAIIMISREIIISSLREWMAEVGRRNKISVSWISKIKTTLQMISLAGLLWRPNLLVENFSIFLMYISAVLTFWSMFRYLKIAYLSEIQ
ncbi:CDP-diacylglycerol--glycerol-3-phosphate 3-phosphatidyltransferase [Candidatus Providencia siddallii]|uniref:CDP-diacylglycerol--glycerol-3-phosphate 3-phosphatidyltransferase n=1 Tax=Candidatus Providencia siddallii TaxID=1715285 RepID=A0A0M6W6Y3_9GAMM|nr:CDP-diacylglycerol--glycerol-3-phosphate 3-phosphatidyltransferase [Candidatus Providencia siddallii]